MNTKNILKTLALAMLLVPACNKSEIANDENAEKKGFALPVTVNATREGDDTKATYTDNGDGTGSLAFGAGDKLFVEGSHVDADRFAGTLDYVPATGKFSGTIYTESLYEGTIDDLLNGNYATLLPAGYESYDYLEIIDEGYEARLGENAYNSFATSKKLGVEQLSFEHGEYTSGTGFVLMPQNAILNFTITGLTPSTKVTAALSDDEDWTPDIEGEVTTDGSGNATFAIGLEDSSDLNEFTLSVAGNAITLVNSSTELEAGKIYNINRSAASSAATGHALSSAVVGDIICSDGLAYNGSDYDNLPTGVTAKAKVCYVSGGHGLALALADEGQMNWSTAISTCAAKTPTVTGCTWKLASEAEWNNMIDVAGSRDALRGGFSGVGGSDLQSSMSSKYWSSTETDAENARSIGFSSFGGGWGSATKTIGIFYARACLTF